MKKIIFISILSSLMVLGNFSPIIVNAEKSSQAQEGLTELQKLENGMSTIQYEKVDFNEDTGIDTIHMNFNGNDHVGVIDNNTGEFMFDGQLLAIIRDDISSEGDGTLITPNSNLLKDSPISIAAASYYTIGSSSHGSGFYKNIFNNTKVVDVIGTGMTAAAAAAMLASMYLKKLNKTGFAETIDKIGIAAMFLSLLGSSYLSFTMDYKHYEDLERNFWRMDILRVYRGTAITSSQLKLNITHYYGNTF